MRRNAVLAITFFLMAGIASLQIVPPQEKPVSAWMPAGALVSIEAKDLGSLLGEWSRSQTKNDWLQSANHAAFTQSNLLRKMSGVYAQYASAAGFAPGLPQLLEVAGTESALALYDPRELQFLYITKLSNARFTQSQLWAVRDKFERRESAGKPFYLRVDGERTVAFAFSGDYLFAATRDDLIARALALQSAAAAVRMADERWYRSAVSASAGAGDLRMVLNLGALVKNTYFRSYWIQRNVADLRPYLAEICDVDRKGAEFDERRALVRGPDTPAEVPAEASRAALARLVASAPATAGLYRAWAAPDGQQMTRLIEKKLLLPRVQASRDSRYAPAAPGEGNAGSDEDLETRIDEVPLSDFGGNVSASPPDPLFANAKLAAAIEIQSSELPAGLGFVSFPSVIGMEGESDWDADQVRAAVARSLAARISSGASGVQWVTSPLSGRPVFRLDGLMPFFEITRGRVLFLSNNQELLRSVLDASAKAQPTGATEPITYAASFGIATERANYGSLMRALDTMASGNQGGSFSPNRPPFFSSNVESLVGALRNLQRVDIREQSLPDRTLQFVRYF